MVDVAEVEKAIVAVFDAATPPAQREMFNKGIDDLMKGDGEVLITVALGLLSSPNYHVVHIGFKFIDEAIRFKWNSLPVLKRVSLRDELLRRISLGPPPIPQAHGGSSAPLMIAHWAEPIARCLSAMAEQEWPQNWPEFATQLADKAVNAALPSTAVAVLCVMRRLQEDVIIFGTVSNYKRKKELHQALCDSIKGWLALVIQLLSKVNVKDADSLLVVKLGIGWLSQAAEWVAPAEIEPLVDNIIDQVVRFLTTAEHGIYEEAAVCLTAFASRKKAATADKTVTTFFRGNVISPILETANMVNTQEGCSESHYKYLKALCETLTTVGQQLTTICNAEKGKGGVNRPPENFSLFLSALAAFAAHPSLWLRSEATLVLARFASSSVIASWKEYQTAVKQLIPQIPELFQKGGMPSESPPSISAHYSKMDFDDDIEWAHDFMQYRTRLMNFVRDTTEPHLRQYLEMSQDRFFNRVITSAESFTLTQWETSHKITRAVFSVAFDRKLLDQATIAALKETFIAMINVVGHSRNWWMANEAMSTLSCLVPVIDTHPECLQIVLELVRFLAMESGEDEKELKRHCISTIIRFPTSHQEVAKTHWREIFSVCEQMSATSSQMQRAQIANAIAALSNVVPSEEEQKRLLEIALVPQLENLRKLDGVFTDVQTFLHLTGFFESPPLTDEQADAHEGVQRRKMLRSTLSAFEGVLQKVPSDSPVGPVLVPECEKFARLVRILFSLYDPAVVAAVHSAYGGLLDIPFNERQAIYCSVGENIEAATGRRASEQRSVVSLAISFLSEINDTLQSILSLCCSKFPSLFYSSPALPSILDDCCANIGRIPDFRVRYWLKKAWLSFYTSCPPSSFHLLTKSMDCIVTYLNDRTTNLWNAVSKIDYDSEPTEEELFTEHMTCVLSRELIAFLRFVFVAETSGGVLTGNGDNPRTGPSSPVLSPLGCFFFEQGGSLLMSFISIGCNALAWRDTHSCVRAIPIARAIVDKLSSFFDDGAAQFAFNCALQAMRIHGSDEVAIGPLLTLVLQVYIGMRPHTTSLMDLLTTIPETPKSNVETFDNKMRSIIAGNEFVPEKMQKEMVKKLLRPIISVTVGELGRRPVELRPLPPIDRRTKPKPEPDYSAIAQISTC